MRSRIVLWPGGETDRARGEAFGVEQCLGLAGVPTLIMGSGHVLDVHVGVAHAGAVHPHHDLVTYWRRVGPILERQRHPDGPHTATRTTRP